MEMYDIIRLSTAGRGGSGAVTNPCIVRRHIFCDLNTLQDFVPASMFIVLVTALLSCLVVRGNSVNRTGIAYSAEELLPKLSRDNEIQPRKPIKFEDQFKSNYVVFDDHNLKVPNETPSTLESNQEAEHLYTNYNNDNRLINVKFENLPQNHINNRNNTTLGNGKKKRRRRILRQQLAGPGPWISGYPSPNRPVLRPSHSFGSAPETSSSFGSIPGSMQGYESKFQSDFNGQLFRPTRRPQSSLASDALTAVTGALTSIAHNDDYQCVARLLCEAAAGGALGGTNLLESISGLQPLLTLVSAYNGISSNPLFVFGRAAFLGMSSKGNPGSCRYAYPQCPTDPEQLVHYLNNHNGGFFRFFNVPQHGQHNLEQFYNQLSQNYGLLQPNLGYNQEFYGLLNSAPYQSPTGQANLYSNDNGYPQNYGVAYPYSQNYNIGAGSKYKSYEVVGDNDRNQVKINANRNKIEKRIQNKPVTSLTDNFVGTHSKWLFPEDDDYMGDDEIGIQYINNEDFGYTNEKKSKTVKFPDTNNFNNNIYVQDYIEKPNNLYTTQTVRKAKGISFPESKSSINHYNANMYQSPVRSNSNSYINDKKITHTDGHVSYDNYREEPGITTVYVVRGNGDPNKPEIVKLRPGETL